jgi:hypothetical protein
LAPPPNHHLADHALLLTCSLLLWIDRDAHSVLSFIGGFDYPVTATNPTLDSRMLIFKYPAADFDQVRQHVPTIDYDRARPPV